MTTKKQWKQPELIVLVRGKPEEAVLTACKVGGLGVCRREASESRLQPVLVENSRFFPG